MCGITGILITEPSNDVATHVCAMTQMLFHRGPDDGGLVVFGPVNSAAAVRLGRPEQPVDLPHVPAFAGLGVRRLAILDRSDRGHQPMAARDRLAWIAHNGEIYNYIELRDQLRSDGWQFDSGTDTEVILAAWQTWGPACFERFDGMWAMAIYEPDARRLILSRDRFGIKPLYYMTWSTGLAFASEIKSLLALPDQSRRINEPRLADFLCEGLIDHTDETLFDGVFSLPGGCTLAASLDPTRGIALRHERYWRPWDGPVRLASSGDAPNHNNLRAALESAIRVQLRSDVPVGSCLSGGIDSSALVTTLHALAARDPTAPGWSQHTFTAAFPGDRLDESRYADAVIAACPGLHPHRAEPAAADLLRDLDRLLWHQDEPFGSPSIFMQWEVMRLAASTGVRVLLDGQGADELFCGYPGYFSPWIAQRLRDGRWREAFALLRHPFVREHFSPAALRGHVIAHLFRDPTRDSVRRALRAFRCRHVSRDLLDRTNSVGEHADHHVASARRGGRTATDDVPHASPSFTAHCWDVLLSKSLPSLLHFEDRNSMAFSIEARVPFLGRDVADLAIALPAGVKLAHGRTKAILRDAMRGRVPDAILDRTDKIGFAAPTLRWMQGPLREWWYDALTSSACTARGWFERRSLRKLTQRLDHGDPRAALILWRAAVTEHWATCTSTPRITPTTGATAS